MPARLFGTFSTSNHQWHANKILLSPSISSNYHQPTIIAWLPSRCLFVIIGTFGHYQVFCKILSPTKVYLHSHLLLNTWISSKAHSLSIVSWNALFTSQMMPFLFPQVAHHVPSSKVSHQSEHHLLILSWDSYNQLEPDQHTCWCIWVQSSNYLKLNVHWNWE